MQCFIRNVSIVCCSQCSECVDGHMGTPTNGHQCYLQMDIEKEYYFEPLLRDRTEFYAVQPKYLNVDIKIIIDVNMGGQSVSARWSGGRSWLYVEPRV